MQECLSCEFLLKYVHLHIQLANQKSVIWVCTKGVYSVWTCFKDATLGILLCVLSARL